MEKKVQYDSDVENSKFALIINKTFEEELCRKISLPEYKQKILDIIKEDLEYIYGSCWKELFTRPWSCPSFVCTAFRSAEGIVLMLLLSKSGFLPGCYRYGRIEISNFDVANAYECLKILQCVEKNIQAKRDPKTYSFVYLPHVEFRRDKKNKVVELVRYEWPCSGKFYLSFQSICTTSKFKIKDIHDTGLVQSCKNNSLGERSGKKNPYIDKLII